jgi:hypothetical protein
MKALNDNESVRPSRPTGMDGENEGKGESRSGVVGNERLTALAGAVLLVLILVEIVSAAYLHALLPIHVFVGVLLACLLVVKLGSTGYRFVRYYTRSPAYVRSGPPRLPLRLLAPLLLVATLVVVGSGIGLVVAGPVQSNLLRSLHSISVLFWLSLIAIHVVAYLWRTLRWVADDWRKHPAEQAPGRGFRLGVNLGALLVGVVSALLLFPGAAPWVVWIQRGQNIPDTLIEGLILAIVVLLVTRPFKWR